MDSTTLYLAVQRTFIPVAFRAEVRESDTVMEFEKTEITNQPTFIISRNGLSNSTAPIEKY